MLACMWRKGLSYTAAGSEIGAATMETSMEVPQKAISKTTI